MPDVTDSPPEVHRSGSNSADVERDSARGQRTRAKTGIIGFLVIGLVVLTALQMNNLPFLAPVSTYRAFFDDAGGLVPGDVVAVAGVNIGSVENIALANTPDGTKAAVRFRINDKVKLGVDTQAAIKTETVLGRRNLTLIPHGPGRILPGGEIANENTVAPYSLTDALDNASGTLEETDTDQLRVAVDTLSRTFSATPASVRGANQSTPTSTRVPLARAPPTRRSWRCAPRWAHNRSISGIRARSRRVRSAISLSSSRRACACEAASRSSNSRAHRWPHSISASYGPARSRNS